MSYDESVWVIIETYQGIVEKASVFKEVKNAEDYALGVFKEHVDTHESEHLDNAMKERLAKGEFGSCPCEEFDVVLIKCELE